MSGRAPRDKGNRTEREWVAYLVEQRGYSARRVPLSGAAAGFKGDVHVNECDGGMVNRAHEVKRRHRIPQWMKPADGIDAVVVREDGDPNGWLVIVRAEDWSI